MEKINTKNISNGIFRLVLPLFILLFVQSVANAQSLPEGYVSCAKEGEQCQFQGTKEVRYGADTRWKIMTATNGIKCDYVTFGGDPAYGTHKQCYIKAATTTAPANLSGYDRYVNAQPSQTDLIPASGMKMIMGANTSSPSSIPTGNDERGLPFTDYGNMPAFYFIPADKRPKILNQGGCGSCVAWSTSTAIASIIARQGNYPTFNPGQNMPDALKFFLMADRTCETAWWTETGVNRMTTTGAFLSVVQPTNKNQVFESFWEGLLSSSTSSKPVSNWWIKAGTSGKLTNKDAMRKFIYTQGALVADFDVMSDFGRYQSGIYDHQDFVSKAVKPLKDNPQTATAGQQLEEAFNTRTGGHAVTVIGYFAGGKISLKDYMKPIMPDVVFPDIEMTLPAFWIIQNSWSDKWGMNGLIYIAANQSYQRRRYDDTNKRWLTETADTIDDTMYYMLNPTITAASNGRDVRNAAPAPRSITFRNEAGYVAKMRVAYYEQGSTQPKYLYSDNIPVGQGATLELPPTRPNTPIAINLIGTATYKDNFYSTTIDAAFAGTPCYKAWGTIFSPQGGSCSDSGGNATTADRALTFRNEAGFVAKMMVQYLEVGPGGVPMPKFLFTDDIPVGQSKTLVVPASAPNTQVTVSLIGSGTTKDNFYSTNLEGAFSGSRCFKAWGTLFSPQGGTCQ